MFIINVRITFHIEFAITVVITVLVVIIAVFVVVVVVIGDVYRVGTHWWRPAARLTLLNSARRRLSVTSYRNSIRTSERNKSSWGIPVEQCIERVIR